MPVHSSEQAALAYLLQAGLTLLDRNWRCRWGELDLVMRHGDTVVFVEVRYRASAAFGGAAASIDRGKRSRLAASAQAWLQQARQSQVAARLDVVAITGPPGQPHIEWIPNAFGLDET
jgi:putative endonuclease